MVLGAERRGVGGDGVGRREGVCTRQLGSWLCSRAVTVVGCSCRVRRPVVCKHVASLGTVHPSVLSVVLLQAEGERIAGQAASLQQRLDQLEGANQQLRGALSSALNSAEAAQAEVEAGRARAARLEAAADELR